MNWYLLQAKPNAQMLAIENLRRQGFEVFMPKIYTTAKMRGKFVDKLKPLFPGYFFMGTDLSQIPWNSINATRGVSKAVTLDGSYRPVSIQIVEGIRRRCDKKGVMKKINDLASGDQIKIERGPFTDFICNVDKMLDDERAFVLISILQQQIRAKVSVSDVIKMC